MRLSIEELAVKANDQFQDLAAFAGNGELRIDLFERELFARLLALGKSLTQGFIATQGTGDVGEEIERDGDTWRRLDETHARRYVSIFGELSIERTVYGTRETQKIAAAPLDEKLALPDGEFSHVLQDWLQRMCIKDSFSESVESLDALLSLTPSVRSGEAMNHRMAEHTPNYRLGQPAPEADSEGELLVISADGKGVVMRRPTEPSEDAQSTDTEMAPAASPAEYSNEPGKQPTNKRQGNKRMSYVGAAYTIDPFVRTADDVMNELNRSERAKDRPAPKNKRLWAEMTRLVEDEPVNGKVALFGQLADEADRRGHQCHKIVICLMDGEAALWNEADRTLRERVEILDLLHVAERLTVAAEVFHEKGSDEAQAFAAHRLRMLLEGKVGRVIGGFRQMIAKHKLKGKRYKALREVIVYYENNRQRMKYDEYLAAGYPIGSGVIEGACRHLVKDRMEGTGMRWTVANAQAMLHLRSVYLNGDWDEFIEHRIQNELNRQYGSHSPHYALAS